MHFFFQFKRMLNKELSHFAEHNKSDNQIAEYICSTYLGIKSNTDSKDIDLPEVKIEEEGQQQQQKNENSNRSSFRETTPAPTKEQDTNKSNNNNKANSISNSNSSSSNIISKAKKNDDDVGDDDALCNESVREQLSHHEIVSRNRKKFFEELTPKQPEQDVCALLFSLSLSLTLTAHKYFFFFLHFNANINTYKHHHLRHPTKIRNHHHFHRLAVKDQRLTLSRRREPRAAI